MWMQRASLWNSYGEHTQRIEKCRLCGTAHDERNQALHEEHAHRPHKYTFIYRDGQSNYNNHTIVTVARATDSSPNLNMIFIMINGTDIWSFIPGSWWLLSSKFFFIMITNYRNPGLFWRYKTISMTRSWEVLTRLSLEM